MKVKLFRQSPKYGTFCIEFDHEDAKYALYRKWCLKVDGNRRYARSNGLSLHRLIMKPKKGEYVDHIDGNGLNNCRDNLRICSNAENLRNSPPSKRNRSGFKGVSWYKPAQKWVARISVEGKDKHLGYFDKLEDAVAAYQAAAEKWHKEYAWFLRSE